MGHYSSKLKKRKMSSEQPAAIVISNFRTLDGRRFHNDDGSNYPLPNDDEECDRLHLQHFLLRYIWQSNFSAPVNDVLCQEGSTVLDIGCGAASWIMEMATNYPHAQFTGLDMAPIQPTEIKPRNVNFIKANLLDGLPFEDNSFDYVFQRFLFGGIPSEKWSWAVGELVRVLKPGGFLELMEPVTFSNNLGPNTEKLNNIAIEFGRRKGLDLLVIHKLKSYCEEQSQLENIHTEKIESHFGSEAGRLGQVLLNNYVLVFKAVKIAYLQTMDITSEEFDELLDNTLKECKEFNTSMDTRRVYARKKLN